MTLRFLLAGFALLHFSSCYAQPAEGDSLYNDGPYFFYENGQAIARWIEENRVKTDTLETGSPFEWNTRVSEAFDPAYWNVETAFRPQRKSSFSGVKKIAAVSDIHGQYGMLKKLLQAHLIIDANNDWIFGEGHLAIVGDVFDRGDEVTEILWLIHKLEQQAEKAGGKVHFLLGNHEIMVLQGDLRYVHEKYRYTSAGFKMSYHTIFDANSYLGKWLRTKNIAVSINKTTFVHAGFSDQYLQLGLTIDQMNDLFRKEIIDQPEDSIMANPVLRILYDELGPVWYRGYFSDGFTEEHANAILQKIGKKNIVVGHTSFSGVVSKFKHKIIGVDSSIKFGKTGEILLVENKRFYRGLLNGDKVLLE